VLPLLHLLLPLLLAPPAGAATTPTTANVPAAASEAGPGSAQAAAAAPLPETKKVTDHLDALYRSDAATGRMRMEVVTAHYERTLEMDSWSRGEGTATLRTDEGLWNYAPRADRLMRIPSGLLSDSWMGSHFTNDDLMRESSYDDDYDTTLSWAEEGGTRYLQMRLVPKPSAAVVYTRIVFILTADEWLPVRADYYDDDAKVRVTHFRDVRDFGGRRVPAVMDVRPTDKPKERTVVTYLDLKFDMDVPKRVFTPRGLRKAAQRR
jgi:outer membrane lipoprotein-sorting protein